MTYPNPPAPRKPKRWPWALGICAALFVGIGIGGAGTTPSASPAAPVRLAPAQAVPADTPSAKDDEVVAGTIPEGEWQVPSEVGYGTYRTAGPEEGFITYCQVTTHNAAGDVIDWKNSGTANAPILVTIRKGAVSVTNSGCPAFRKIG